MWSVRAVNGIKEGTRMHKQRGAKLRVETHHKEEAEQGLNNRHARRAKDAEKRKDNG